jgi:hypothetical protein
VNDYRKKTDAELHFIMKDAHEAAECMKGMDPAAECKYLDQVNDAATELYRRHVRRADKKGTRHENQDRADVR